MQQVNTKCNTHTGKCQEIKNIINNNNWAWCGSIGITPVFLQQQNQSPIKAGFMFNLKQYKINYLLKILVSSPSPSLSVRQAGCGQCDHPPPFYARLWESGGQTKLALRIFGRNCHKNQWNFRLNKENGGRLDIR